MELGHSKFLILIDVDRPKLKRQEEINDYSELDLWKGGACFKTRGIKVFKGGFETPGPKLKVLLTSAQPTMKPDVLVKGFVGASGFFEPLTKRGGVPFPGMAFALVLRKKGTRPFLVRGS